MMADSKPDPRHAIKPHLRKMFDCKNIGSGNFVQDFFGKDEDATSSTAGQARTAIEKNEQKDRDHKA